jgi:hypothetical protein
LGFTNPSSFGDVAEIIAGHACVSAAKLIGMTSVPTPRLSHLNAVDGRAYILADNKPALNASWDREILAIEMQSLIDLNFDLELTGFALAEVDLVLDAARDGDAAGPAGPEDQTQPNRRHPAWATLAVGSSPPRSDFGRAVRIQAHDGREPSPVGQSLVGTCAISTAALRSYGHQLVCLESPLWRHARSSPGQATACTP